jgi:flagellar biosynthesis protein FliQ
MNESDAVEMLQAAIWAACLVAGPLVVPAMVIGIVIAVLQAATQVQESTLTFLPKMAVVIISAFAASSLIGSQLILLAENAYGRIAAGY